MLFVIRCKIMQRPRFCHRFKRLDQIVGDAAAHADVIIVFELVGSLSAKASRLELQLPLIMRQPFIVFVRRHRPRVVVALREIAFQLAQ